MSKISIVYYSDCDCTQKQAEAVYVGAALVCEAELIEIDDEGNISDSEWALLNDADAIVYGSPTNMGSVAWQFKKFADASSAICAIQAWKDKICAGFGNTASFNGDKSFTLHYLLRFAHQHGMIWVGNGEPQFHTKEGQRNDSNWIGSTIRSAKSTVEAALEKRSLLRDLEMARLFGMRVAQIAQKMND